jgi:lipid A disaccharide synthetase
MAPPAHGASTTATDDDAEDKVSASSSLVDPSVTLDLHHIKHAYLPSILLAYNGALTFASSIVGPEILLKSLELANLLADSELNSDLTSVIVEAGRMQDLVESLALSQTRLIRMQQDAASAEKRARREEERRGKGGARGRGTVRKKRSALSVRRREWRGETLDLWDASKG